MKEFYIILKFMHIVQFQSVRAFLFFYYLKFILSCYFYMWLQLMQIYDVYQLLVL